MDIFTSVSSKTFPFESHDNMGVYGDASFPSYLNGKDDNFIRELSDSTRYLNANIISAAEDGEIGVFRAERYFNGGMDDDSSQKSTSKKPSFDDPTKPKLWLGTPSLASESTTTNSQTALLQISNTAAAAAVAAATAITSKTTTNSNSSPKKTKNFLSSLVYCKCYSCKDNNSVDVNEDVGEISFSNAATKLHTIKCIQKVDQLSTGSFRESHFTFPTGPAMSPIKLVHFSGEEETERKSLEVFGSPVMGRLRNKPLSLEKRLAMLSWDHAAANAAAAGGGVYYDDEVNSDCSSDLFEIESLTNKAANMLLGSGCYAPSEASVEWSVVTASAADFEERRPSTATAAVMSPAKAVATSKEVQKRRSSGSLLGCNSEKAIKVAGNVHKPKSELSAPEKRFEEEAKKGGGLRNFRSLPRPYSPRLSNISFNIQ